MIDFVQKLCKCKYCKKNDDTLPYQHDTTGYSFIVKLAKKLGMRRDSMLEMCNALEPTAGIMQLDSDKVPGM